MRGRVLRASRPGADVCACLLIHGRRRYHRAGREAARSLLANSDLDVFVALGSGDGPRPPRSPRLRIERLRDAGPAAGRAAGFLLKFDALDACLRASKASHFVLLDADAVLVASTRGSDVRAALGDRPLGMVEQKGIRGSEMDRLRFLDHYLRHSLAFLAPGAPAPSATRFRFFNSGVVLGTREEFGAIVRWARERMAEAGPEHRVGEHMIADQDYFQVWANSLRPGACAELGWQWNHCEHWDEGFPRAGARILHFSNFCRGPGREDLLRMRAARRGRLTVRSIGEKAPPAAPVPLGNGEASLGIVIVTFESAQTLPACLAGIGPDRIGSTLVVDNGSRDASVAIARSFGARVLPLAENLGFGRAATRGARELADSHLCFLNPDCVPRPELFDAGLAALRGGGRRGAAPFLVEPGRVIPGAQPGYSRTKLLADVLETNYGRRSAAWVRRLPFHDDGSWSWPHGACFFIGRDFFQELGGFDDAFFVYMEDVDLGRRIAAAGGEVVALRERLVHRGGRGSGLTRSRRPVLLDEARLAYGRRVYGDAFAALLRASVLPAEIWRRVSGRTR
jgi:GT2 family glycosyltransferase